MMTYSKQVERIKTKLIEAKKADNYCKVFGANSHNYHVGQPATIKEVAEFEEKFAVQLPECYKAFITQVGNGGNGESGSAAGPFYGIYPLGKNAGEILEYPEHYLSKECIIYPKMTDAFWQSLTKEIDENHAITDEEYEKELGIIYAGILPIGSQGCTFLHGIILNGPFKGRIVNLDVDRQKPSFTVENNFLDWYEKWLDEIISGKLISDTPIWFGYVKDGTEEDSTL